MSQQITSHDSETPAEGKQVFTACAFIHKNFDGIRKVFLPKRALTKKFLPDVYELPGGHIDFGEDMKVGLKREIKEEFEIEASIGDPFFVFTYINDIKGSHSIEVIYFAQFVDDISSIKIHSDDHSGFIWASEDELQQVYTLQKGEDDIEMQGVKRGFALLKGNSITFG